MSAMRYQFDHSPLSLGVKWSFHLRVVLCLVLAVILSSLTHSSLSTIEDPSSASEHAHYSANMMAIDTIGNGEPYDGYDALCVDTDPPPNCTSNDFVFLEAFLAEDTLGNPLTNCIIGQASEAYFCLTFDKGNGADRRGFYISSTIIEGGVNTYEINHCFNQLFSGQQIVTLCIPNEIITFSCGTELFVQDSYFGWGSSSANSNICEQTSGCASPKCDIIIGQSELITPLFAGFQESKDCMTGDSIEVVNFEDLTVGGYKPYSYDWDFGDGNQSTLQNPSHLYSDTGTYTVSLIVTDNESQIDTFEKTISVYLTDYVNVFAGDDIDVICTEEDLPLEELSATINGAITSGIWSSTGDGTFNNNGNFGGGSPATLYTYGPTDIVLGQVTLILTSDDPPGICEPQSDNVLVNFNILTCSTFPYLGN